MVNKNTIPYILLAVVIVFFLIREGCNQSSRNDLVADVSNYKTEAEHYKGLNGVEVAQNRALMLDNQEQIKSLLDKNDTLSELMKQYKKLRNVTIMENTTQIINDSIAYDTIKIPCDFEPFQVRRDSSHYMFAGTVAPDFFRIDSLKIHDEQSLVFGKRKTGFLKRPEYTAEVVHSNPLIRTTNIGTYSIKEKRKKFVISVGGTWGFAPEFGTTTTVIGVHAGFPLVSF
jgi:hypothetical protein